MPYIDTRDLDKRLGELEDEETLDEDEQTELEELRELRDQLSEWSDGETMIPEHEFEDYARELADDLGVFQISVDSYSGKTVDVSSTWPFTCIDWEHAAKELAYDYTTVTYQGNDYMVRSS